MMILAIDTATSWQSVAILENRRVRAWHGQDAMGSHTRYLLPTINRLLTTLHIGIADFTGLALSIGPGSFSGLRVGLSTLLGFRLALGFPLVGVPTLEAMAWNIRDTNFPLCPILKSRTGEVHWAMFRWVGTTLNRLQEDRIGTLEELAQSVTEPTRMYGEGWLANRDRLNELLAGRGHEGPQEVMMTSAKSVGLASLERLTSGDYLDHGFTPRYGQPSYAELNWKRKVNP